MNVKYCKRSGQGTLLALLMLIIFVTATIATVYVVSTAMNRYIDTSKKVFKKVSEEGVEKLEFLDAYIDESDSTLVIKVKNTGDVTLRIISIWLNNTVISLNNTNLYLSPGEIKTIDTNVTISASDKYIISIVSARGKIYYGRFPPPGPGEWKHLSYSPVVFPPGSTATYAEEPYKTVSYYPENYSVLNGSLVAGSLSSLYSDDDNYLTIDSTPLSSTFKFYHATSYISDSLIGSIESGDVTSVWSSDDEYLIISSTPVLSNSILYAHSETYALGNVDYYMLKTMTEDGTHLIINYTTTDSNWHQIAAFIYPLNGLTLQQGMWDIYYRVKVVSPGGGVAGWALPGWQYYKVIYITEYTGSDLNNYQLRIVLNESNFNFDHANQDGSDIRFLDSDQETMLDYWIEKWSYSNKEAIIWVKIPNIEGGSTKIIYMYYGNPSATYDPTHYGLDKIIESLPESDGSNYKIYYQEWVMSENMFQSIGDPMGWHGDDKKWRYHLPFEFPYYKKKYSSIYVCSNGFIGIPYRGADYSSTENELKKRGMIAPYWADLMTYGSGKDIYIKRDYHDEFGDGVYIRWRTTYYIYSGNQNFAVVLYNNGLIRFDYGSFSGFSITDDTPVIGISFGDRVHYTISSYNGRKNPTNFNSVLFWPRKKATTEPGVSIGNEYIPGGGSLSIDVIILDSGGNIVDTIGSKVAVTYVNINNTWTTVSGRYNFPGYSSSEGEYLEIIYNVKGASSRETYFYLDIDDPNIDPTLQTRVDLGSPQLPGRYRFSIEFIGSSNLAKIWNNITYGLESHYDNNNVNVTVALYNFNLDRYSKPGEEGYLSFIYNGTPSDVYESGIISTNPTNYRNETGYWRIKISGYRDTVFNERFRAYLDYIEFKVSFVNKYGILAEFRFSNITEENIYKLTIVSKMKYNLTGPILSYIIYNYTTSSWSLLKSWLINTLSESFYNYTFTSGFSSILSNGILLIRMNTTLVGDDASPFRQYIDLNYIKVIYIMPKVIYVGRGGTNETYMYIISQDNWTRVADAPFTWNGIARLLYVSYNHMIYAFNETHLCMYNTTSGKWSVIGTLPETAGDGASLAYSSGIPDILVYIVGGGSTSVYIYNISSSVWSQATDVPEPISSYSMSVGDDNGYIYVITGRSTGSFYKYNIANDTWIKIGVAPASEIGGITFYNNFIYISDLSGGLYRYTISNNTWNSIKPTIPVKTEGEGYRLFNDGIFLYYLRFDYTAEILRTRIARLVIY